MQKRVFSYLCALFLLLTTFSLVFCFALLSTIGNPSYFSNEFMRDSYITACADGIQTGIADLGSASGIPADELTGVVSRPEIRESVKNEIAGYIRYIGGYADTVQNAAPSQAFLERVRARIELYIKKAGFTQSASTTTAVDAYITKCGAIYTNNLILIPYFGSAAKAIRGLLALCRRLLPLFAALFILFVFLCLLFSRSGEKAFFIFSGISGGSLIAILLSGPLILSKAAFHTGFTSAEVKTMVGVWISGIFRTALTIAVPVFILSVFLLIPARFAAGRKAAE